MAKSSDEPPIELPAAYQPGEHLQCRRCGAEIEIITPCSGSPPVQSFVCCGEEMTPTEDLMPHLNIPGFNPS
jgi:hypothetical protein